MYIPWHTHLRWIFGPWWELTPLFFWNIHFPTKSQRTAGFSWAYSHFMVGGVFFTGSTMMSQWIWSIYCRHFACTGSPFRVVWNSRVEEANLEIVDLMLCPKPVYPRSCMLHTQSLWYSKHFVTFEWSLILRCRAKPRLSAAGGWFLNGSG